MNFAALIKNPALWAFLGVLITKIGSAATGQTSWTSIIVDVVLAAAGLFITKQAVDNKAALQRAGLMKP